MSTATAPRAKKIPSAPKATPAPSNSGRTVTVANRTPYTFELRLCDMVDEARPIPGGGGVRTVRVGKQLLGLPVIIRGNSFASKTAPDFQLVGGHALTYGVPADFWDRWVSENRDLPAVRNGHLFAEGSHGNAEGRAREQKDNLTGFEPLDRTRPLEIQKPQNAKVA